jgi:polyisoprenoid-binding protein YceI
MNRSFLALCLLFAASPAFAQSKISVVVGLTPAGSFTAVSEKMKGDVIQDGTTYVADKLTVLIESFKTGINLRDEHFWKHLESDKFPKATLSNLKASNGTGTANLEVHGVTKPVAITYTEKAGQITAHISTQSSLFGMPKATYLGVGVKDDVNIDIQTPYKKKTTVTKP